MEHRRIKRTLRRTTSHMPAPAPEAWEVASKQCDRIVDMIEELEDNGVVDKAPDFFESVKEKTINIQEDIDRKCRVTEKEQQALNNMERGVEAWMH